MASTRIHFEREIKALQEQMLEMANCTDTMLDGAIQGLITGDLNLIQDVIRRDDIVDNYDISIESTCLMLIATQQPVAHDLRSIGTALKAITDIERIGDYAVDIAKIGRRLIRAQELYRPIADIPRLTGMARAMLHDALQAFVHHDLELVEKVIQDDDAVDRLYHQIRDDLTKVLMHEQGKSLLALNVLFTAKYLERVSDHVVNIAERVYFLETGEMKQLAEDHRPNSESS